MDAQIKSYTTLFLGILLLIHSNCFSQQYSSLSKEIDKSIFNALIMLDDNRNKEEHSFLIKLELDEQHNIRNIDLSDNIDALYKEDFLDNFNTAAIQKALRGIKLSSKTVLIPVAFFSIDKPKLSPGEFLLYHQFKGKPLNEQVYMMPVSVVKTKYSEN